jgi:hypothetical protein
MLMCERRRTSTLSRIESAVRGRNMEFADNVTTVPEIISCPEPGCSAPAEVLDRQVLESTCGPVAHLKASCLNGHGFTLATDRW